jgi:acetoacetyl-CoA synthetase
MNTKSIADGTILWEPGVDVVSRANMTRYMQWLAAEKGLTFGDYISLWQWSVTEIEDFWQSLWEYFDIRSSKPYSTVLNSRKMPGARWFTGAELNYAEHVFRHRTPERPALIF